MFDKKLGIKEYELLHQITTTLMELQDLNDILKSINRDAKTSYDELEHLAFAMNNQVDYLERKIYNY